MSATITHQNPLIQSMGTKLLSLQSHVTNLRAVDIREHDLNPSHVALELQKTEKKRDALQGILNGLDRSTTPEMLRKAKKEADTISGVSSSSVLSVIRKNKGRRDDPNQVSPENFEVAFAATTGVER